MLLIVGGKNEIIQVYQDHPQRQHQATGSQRIDKEAENPEFDGFGSSEKVDQGDEQNRLHEGSRPQPPQLLQRRMANHPPVGTENQKSCDACYAGEECHAYKYT